MRNDSAFYLLHIFRIPQFETAGDLVGSLKLMFRHTNFQPSPIVPLAFFLHERKLQCTVFIFQVHQVCHSMSSIVYILCSVPQGLVLVLGPQLFILYSADLEDLAKEHCVPIHSFADDTVVLAL